ncbi:MAG TPA: response regulator [Spirochaetota bacterium]|nr:response regulator [Spirochaetota bacterium]
MIKSNNIVGEVNKKDPDGLKTNGQPYRVLVVDDSGVMRKIITQVLKSESYDVCGQAADGEEAVARFKELKPDVVTMDINMPKLGGVEALEKILALDSSAKVVMLTSEGQKETVLDAVSKGAKNYIVKPPQRNKVLEKVKDVVNG